VRDDRRLTDAAQRSFVMAKSIADLLQWLPTVALFGGLEEKTLMRLIESMTEHQLKAGSQVCKQGDIGRSMFLVRSGEVMVSHDTESGKRIKMVRLGVGEFFGEMTLIDIQKRSASVFVERDAVLFSLGNRELYALYNEDVPGYVMLLQNICRELSRRLRVTNARMQSLAHEGNDHDEKTLIRPAVSRKTT
jgi:CRP/FNR family transcriptional regulator, cyclic AMP receptor protein